MGRAARQARAPREGCARGRRARRRRTAGRAGNCWTRGLRNGDSVLRSVRHHLRAGRAAQDDPEGLRRQGRRGLRTARHEHLRRPDTSRGEGGEGQHRRADRASRRLRHVPERRSCPRCHRCRRADQDAAGATAQDRQARDDEAVLRSALSGDVHHGREQGRAQVHAGGSRHQRAHVWAVVPVGQDDPPEDRAEPLRHARQRPPD